MPFVTVGQKVHDLISTHRCWLKPDLLAKKNYFVLFLTFFSSLLLDSRTATRHWLNYFLRLTFLLNVFSVLCFGSLHALWPLRNNSAPLSLQKKVLYLSQLVAKRCTRGRCVACVEPLIAASPATLSAVHSNCRSRGRASRGRYAPPQPRGSAAGQRATHRTGASRIGGGDQGGA